MFGHLGSVADLRVVDVHGGADPAGQRKGRVLLLLLLLVQGRRTSAGEQLPLQHHRLGVNHLHSSRQGTGVSASAW